MQQYVLKQITMAAGARIHARGTHSECWGALKKRLGDKWGRYTMRELKLLGYRIEPASMQDDRRIVPLRGDLCLGKSSGDASNIATH